jgi:hypothetical protein
MTDRPTDIELIREGHADGDRVVAMHVAWGAVTELEAELAELRSRVEAYEDAIIEGDRMLEHREAMFLAVRGEHHEQ